MCKSTNRIYWLFLAAAALAICCCGLIPGESYASMVSSDVWQAQLQTSAITVSSDYLAEGGQTVLLNDLTQERTITFTLLTNKSQMSGSLSCTVSPEEAVTVSMDEAAQATAEGTTVSLTLSPGVVTEDTEVTVTVCWTAASGQVLQADFQTAIPVNQMETEEPSETDSTIPEETIAEDPAELDTQAETESTEETVPTIDAALAVMNEYVPGSAVAATVNYPEDCRQILLSMADDAAFPAGTRYSTDYGEDDTVLYDPAQIHILPNTGKKVVVLLKLPQSESSSAVTVCAKVVCESGETVLSAQTAPISASLQLPADACYVLTTGDSVCLDLPAGWSDCALSYTIQRMTQTPDGILYETTANASEGLSVTAGADGITIRLTGDTVQAGTYRLTLVWNYMTYTVAQKEVMFYINYSDCSSTATTGGNEQ